MHPAYSVILFTTASGAGYGLLALLGLAAALGRAVPDRGFAAVALVLALGLIVGGLLASTFHLGRPERAWRALSQWRSSWLSREGVLALAVFPPALAFGGLWLATPGGAAPGGITLLAGLGLATALLCAATVAATGMIYASLPTIRQWRQPLVVPVYLAFALASGAVLLLALAAPAGLAGTAEAAVAVLALVLALVLKRAYWQAIDRAPRDLDTAAAIGLPELGPVRQWEPAQTAESFVQREMGYRVARRHAARLRRLVLVALGLAALLAGAVPLLPGPAAPAAALLAVPAVLLAAAVERWLFFAEAQHVVTLYDGAERA